MILTQLAALLVVALVVAAVLRGTEVRLTLTVAAVALGLLTSSLPVILQTFLATFTSEKFLLPIGTCLGFSFVLRHTGCDRELVNLLLRPLRGFRIMLIPGAALVGVVVNIPIISQSAAAAAIGAVLVPVLRSAGFSPVTIAATLALGASIGGELLNPGAPELATVSEVAIVAPTAVVPYIWPLLLTSVVVAVPLFTWLCARETTSPQAPEATEEQASPKVNVFKAMVPLLPLAILFLTALPEPYRAFDVPPAWLLSSKDSSSSFGVRLIGAAMLLGTAVAALLTPSKAGGVMKAFFDGAGYAMTNVVSLIVVANCFAAGIEASKLVVPVQKLIGSVPSLLMPLAALAPLGFGWVSGSGMASTQGLCWAYKSPAALVGADLLNVGSLVSLGAAAGRTLSPVSAVVLMAASLTDAKPAAIVRKMALPLLAGLAAATAVAMWR